MAIKRSTVPRKASVGNISQRLFDQPPDGLFVAVHAEGDFKSEWGVGEGAFLGEDLTHDPVARSAEYLGDAWDLDVDRHRIDQFVVFSLNVRHARQRSPQQR